MELVEDASGTCFLGEGRPRGTQDPFPGRAAADPSPVPPGWGLGSGNLWPCPRWRLPVACQQGRGLERSLFLTEDEEAGAQKG